MLKGIEKLHLLFPRERIAQKVVAVNVGSCAEKVSATDLKVRCREIADRYFGFKPRGVGVSVLESDYGIDHAAQKQTTLALVDTRQRYLQHRAVVWRIGDASKIIRRDIMQMIGEIIVAKRTDMRRGEYRGGHRLDDLRVLRGISEYPIVNLARVGVRGEGDSDESFLNPVVSHACGKALSEADAKHGGGESYQ